MAGFSILAKLGLDSSKFKAGLSKSDSALTKFGKAIGNVVKVGAAIATAAFAAFTVKGIKDLVEFEKSMSEVFTLLPGITKESMDSMSADVRRLAVVMGVDLLDATKALYQAISAGVPAENVFEFMEIAAKASIGGGTSLETAVDGITTVINTYGKESITAKEAADAMFTAVKLGKTTFEELSGALFNVLPIAKQAGVSFDEISAALAVMTAKGTPTAVATTQLRAAMTALLAPTTKTAKAFTTYGLDVANLKDLMSGGDGGLVKAMQNVMIATDGDEIAIRKLLGSTEAMNAVLTLTAGSAKSFGDAMVEMGNKSGALDKAHAAMTQTVAHNMQVMMGQLKELGLKFGAAFLPLINKLLPQVSAAFANLGPAVQNFADGFPALVKSIANFAKTIADVTIAVGAYLVAAKLFKVAIAAKAAGLGLFAAAATGATAATTKLSAATKGNIFGLLAAGAVAGSLAVKRWMQSQKDLHAVMRVSPEVIDKVRTATANMAEKALAAKDRVKMLTEEWNKLNKAEDLGEKGLGNLHDALALRKEELAVLKENQALFENHLGNQLLGLEYKEKDLKAQLKGNTSVLDRLKIEEEIAGVHIQRHGLSATSLQFQIDIKKKEDEILKITKDRAAEEAGMLHNEEEALEVIKKVREEHELQTTEAGKQKVLEIQLRNLLLQRNAILGDINAGRFAEGNNAAALQRIEADIILKEDAIRNIIENNILVARGKEITAVKDLLTELDKALKKEKEIAAEFGKAAEAQEAKVKQLRADLKEAEAALEPFKKFFNFDKFKNRIVANTAEIRREFKSLLAAGKLPSHITTLREFESMITQQAAAAKLHRDGIITDGQNALQIANERREIERRALADAETIEEKIAETKKGIIEEEGKNLSAQEKVISGLTTERVALEKSLVDFNNALGIKGPQPAIPIADALNAQGADLSSINSGVAALLDKDVTVIVEGDTSGSGGAGEVPPLPPSDEVEFGLETTQQDVLDTLRGFFVNQ